MWKDYLSGYIKNNRTSGWSVRLSALICALLLSLLCGLFYNTWKYEVERIVLEEGGWHSRIMGNFDQEDLDTIKNFANVKEVLLHEEGSKGAEASIDMYFDDIRSVFSDVPHIADAIGVSPQKVVYHYELLAMYLIRDSKDTAPRLVFPMFILITVLASASLIVIIHNAFAVSMNARIHQFGIFSSIGATPRQIRACLYQEAAVLCAVPLLVGNLLGIAGSMGLIQLSNVILGSEIEGRHRAIPSYHPLVLLLTLSLTVLTIWISAWLPAVGLSRLTPLEAIKSAGELQLKRKRNSPFLLLLFGVEGELAGNALKAQRKALRTASVSLILSFMAFTIMQCFFSLSGISTRETYFEKYQDAWDIMVTLKDTELNTFKDTEALQNLAGVESAVVYQKALAKRLVTEEEISEEMKAFGGFSHASERDVTPMDGGWLVNVPLVILDDNSFLSYCEQIGIASQLDGAVIYNQIRDVTNPDFRHPDYMPYIKIPRANENHTSVLRQSGKEDQTVEIHVLAYTEEMPVLREEYATLDYYELVHVIPVSLWAEIQGQIKGAEEDCYIRVLAKDHGSPEALNTLQDKIVQLVGEKYPVESENRIQEYETNNKQIQGMKTVLGCFCILFAMIGVGNVFSNTLGFVRQRKREFARYLSIGMTPEELRNMFCIEALVIAGRPILISLFVAAIVVIYMLKLSYLTIGEFLAEAPILPIAVFMLVLSGSVALAYHLAWKNVRKIRLAEVLRDDTMM